jgi:S1-C subfamily serine protease
MANNMKNFVLGTVFGVALLGSLIGGAVVDRLWGIGVVDRLVPQTDREGNVGVAPGGRQEVVDQESVVTRVVSNATPSVVTVSIRKTNVLNDQFPGFDIFGDFFGFQAPRGPSQLEQVEQDIGSGFVISQDGLIVTNKHVVSDASAKYRVVIGKDQVVDVAQIYRDPSNDLAILQIERTGLVPVTMGDSDKLKVGQTVIAIGTALGEFRSTVTTGVISGLGRGITAGGPTDGSERLDNVIQTDAAINPGNSGGPLFNSMGEVVGVNVAVSAQGQNIGFALPINLVKDSIDNFKTTGEFERPFVGVAYRMITKQAALLNDVPAGAYVQQVVENSPAAKGGIQVGDIIMEIDGKKLTDEADSSLANIVNKKKIGDEVTVKLWREGKEQSLRLKLEKRTG